MEIKTKNIEKLMRYFDEERKAAEMNVEAIEHNYKLGLISVDEYYSQRYAAMVITNEHDKIRKILFEE